MFRRLALLWVVLAVVLINGQAQAAGPRRAPRPPGSVPSVVGGAALFVLDAAQPRVSVINSQGTRLAAAVAGGVRLWSLTDGAELVTYPGPGAGYNNLAFSADGLALAAGSPTGVVQVWPVP